jgi:hypothetical protein
MDRVDTKKNFHGVNSCGMKKVLIKLQCLQYSALCKLKVMRASKSKLKRLSLCNPMVPPTADDLHILNSMWCVYIRKVLSGAQSEAQLQARYEKMS